MKKLTLFFQSDRLLRPSSIHKLRGFVGNLFKDYDVVHNHDLTTGKTIYRYPLVQFKMIDNQPIIIAFTEKPVSVFHKIFMAMNSVVIDDIEIPIYEKNLVIEDVDFGYVPDNLIVYEFISPWIALNQVNYKRYVQTSNPIEKNQILKNSLIGNILSMAKGLECWLEKDQNIVVDINVTQKKILLKGESLIGFEGFFMTNFIIPNYIGLGKSVSRGFGTVKSHLQEDI